MGYKIKKLLLLGIKFFNATEEVEEEIEFMSRGGQKKWNEMKWNEMKWKDKEFKRELKFQY